MKMIVWPCPLCGEKINYAVDGVNIARSGFGAALQGTISVENSEHKCR